jgi:hypothetical protein
MPGHYGDMKPKGGKPAMPKGAKKKGGKADKPKGKK